jgi:flagellar basal-body rod protein FlgF
MIRGLYSAVSGMLTAVRRMEVATNDLANAQTTGYKAERTTAATFAEQLVRQIDGARGGPALGALPLSTAPEMPELDLSQGSLQQTGRPLDVALEGPGFLAVQTETGVHFTRDGSLTRDAVGYLATSTGALILGEDGPLQVPPGAVSILADGTVMAGGAAVGRVITVEFAPGTQFNRMGNNELVTSDPGATPTVSTSTVLRQGFLEASNVDLTGTMTTVLELQRAYEANQRMIQYQDQMMGRAVNDIAQPTR